METSPRTLLLVHQAFVGPGEAGGTRHLELLRYLSAAGWRATVITSPLSYLSGRTVARPAGPVEVEPGLTVRAARVRRRLFGGSGQRLLNFVSFALTAGWQAAREPGVDLFFATSPPLFQALATAAVARLRDRPLIVEIRDLWPDMAIEMGVLRQRGAIALARRAERWLYRQADRVVINSPGYREHLLRSGVAAGRIAEIPNGVATAAFDRSADRDGYRRAWGLDQAFIALYSGALGQANDLGQILDAAERLRDRPEIAFVLIGDGSARADLEAAISNRALTSVRILDPEPKERIPDVLAAADLCLATLRPIPLFATTYPNKVFDYLAAGRPVVLTIDGPIRQVVEAAGAGTHVPAGSADQLAATVAAYAADPERREREGQAGHAYVRAHFDRAVQGRRLVDLARSLVTERPPRAVRSRAKRFLDIAFAAAGLVATAPVGAVAALAIKATSPGPVLYTSERIGRDGRPFRLLKFRTMVQDAEHRGLGLRVAANDERITTAGRVLRATSLDELPQLWNVLRGEMSLVGPRPTVRSQVERYTPEQRRRLSVRPGLTGWAQVNGRNALPWEQRIALDCWYIDNWSPALDLGILLRTPGVVRRGTGLYGPGGQTLDLGDSG